MKVAVIISRIDNLGPVKVISNLVNSMSGQNDIEISVFYIDQKINDHIKLMVPAVRLIRNEFRFDDFDIIHTNGLRPDLFAYLNRKKIRYHISTLHNFVFEDLTYAYNKLVSWIFGNIWLILLNRTDKLVCVSATLREYYTRWFNNNRLVVIHNGIAESDYSVFPDKNITDVIDRFRSKSLTVLGFVGILTGRKGVDQILRLLSVEKGLAFVIIGDGKEISPLKNEAKQLDVLERCLFCGFKEDAISYFRFFDLYVMPSKSEGFGLALVEAVQQNIPVVCSDISVFRELFTNEEVTFFKLGDLNSLSEAVTTAQKTRRPKTELALVRYVNNYKSDLMANKYYELYRTLCKSS